MGDILYPAIVVIVAVYAIISGYRKGITNQLASVLGFGFGVVASKILTPEFADSFSKIGSLTSSPEYVEQATQLVCAVTIYFVVFWLFSLFSGILKAALSVFEVGILNRLAGSFFSLVKNLMWVSIVLNLVLCFNGQSGLLRYERADDGNIVAATMAMSPAILGCYGAEDFSYYHQLEEAKTISCNLRSLPLNSSLDEKPDFIDFKNIVKFTS